MTDTTKLEILDPVSWTSFSCACPKEARPAGGVHAAANIETWRRPAILAAAGCLALAMGILVYLTDRDGSRALLIPTIGALAGGNVFGALGQWLPSFVHPFAFSLFTAAALPPCPRPRYAACVVWCAVNVAFELGQHPLVRVRLAGALHDHFGRISLVRPLENYFLRGTFDVGDILAAALGALAAAGLLRLMQRWPQHHHAQ